LPDLRANRQRVLTRLALAARAAGRALESIRCVAVTKSASPDCAVELCALGQLDLGESRADELERKARWLAARGLPAVWHFVGHLQRNKARRVLRIADYIHSVDSLELVETLERLAAEERRRPKIFLQVNTSGEARKSGFQPGEVAAAAARARSAPHLELAGLMTMGPLEDDADHGGARRAFDVLASLAADIARSGAPRPALSMGMSDDLEPAIAAGADWVRIGRAWFEEGAAA
jgi:pyridoxal phosphate enzyme (YggS family)